MNREAARPPIAATAPVRAQPPPGSWTTWKPAHSLTVLPKVTEPAPFGSVMESPGRSSRLNSLPLESLNSFMLVLSIWYTLCGMPESAPRSPW